MSAKWLEDHDEKKGWIVKAVERLKEVLPYGGHKEKETWSMYLPHAIHLATLETTVDDAARASFFERIGYCRSTLGQYWEAGAMHRQALVLRERSMGNKNILTLSKNNFAVALGNQGKYAEAESMHRQTLATSEKVLGVDHPDTLTTMNNLAGVLGRQGKYAEAESMHRQTLATSEKVLGVDHPDTLTSIYCLAYLLAKQHHYAESVDLYKRAYTRYSSILGEDHPTTRACLQHYSALLASREQSLRTEQAICAESGASGKTSKLSRAQGKLGIRNSKFF
ncbi:uncharacterized protein PV09_09651 [Verruconis gallopava]|uniref:MalT-like TPR region domain-containing protein n=1 Tax=Verruconis gallopava TaxID=253628 RepID=A0A0D1X923_9PEZI|nr:uncharacterized protein PV09_09651 [Verruconis gallopava]KIV98555.1 hypothetical protein PV09_09651 [Verruconis gallopava]